MPSALQALQASISTYRIPEGYVLKAAAALPSNRASPGTVSAQPGGDMGTAEKALGWQAIWSSHQVRIAVLGVGLAALTVILFLQDVISRRRRLHRVIRGLSCLDPSLARLARIAAHYRQPDHLHTHPRHRLSLGLSPGRAAHCDLVRLHVGRAVPPSAVFWFCHSAPCRS